MRDFDTAKRSDGDMFNRFYSGMLARGIYLAPSPYEAWFVSTAHDEESIKKTVDSAAEIFRTL